MASGPLARLEGRLVVGSLRSQQMTWLRRFSDPAVACALEAARVCLVIFGPAVGCWIIGFGMGYRRGMRDAATGRVFNPGAG